MKLTYYVPIYKWGADPYKDHDMAHGVAMYGSLQDLYGFESQYGEVVGYFEVSGTIPTQSEFEASQKE